MALHVRNLDSRNFDGRTSSPSSQPVILGSGFSSKFVSLSVTKNLPF